MPCVTGIALEFRSVQTFDLQPSTKDKKKRTGEAAGPFD
jgi:hypothetical protein